MPTTPRSGVLLLTVDLPGVGSMAALESLLAFLKRERLSATFTATDPAGCPLATAVRSVRGHELALRVESPLEELSFSRRFTSRVSTARAAGLTLGTVSLGTRSTDVRWDLLARQGLTAVLASNAGMPGLIGLQPAWRAFADRVIHRMPPLAPPQAIRYGLWQFPRHANLAAAHDGERTIRVVDRVVRDATIAVIAVDFKLLATGQGGLRAVESLLSYAAARRDEGALAVETAATAACQLLTARCATPSKSILRSRVA